MGLSFPIPPSTQTVTPTTSNIFTGCRPQRFRTRMRPAVRLPPPRQAGPGLFAVITSSTLQPTFAGERIIVLTWISTLRKASSLRKYPPASRGKPRRHCARRNELGLRGRGDRPAIPNSQRGRLSFRAGADQPRASPRNRGLSTRNRRAQQEGPDAPRRASRGIIPRRNVPKPSAREHASSWVWCPRRAKTLVH